MRSLSSISPLSLSIHSHKWRNILEQSTVYLSPSLSLAHTHSLTHSLTHPPTHSLTHTDTLETGSGSVQLSLLHLLSSSLPALSLSSWLLLEGSTSSLPRFTTLTVQSTPTGHIRLGCSSKGGCAMHNMYICCVCVCVCVCVCMCEVQRVHLILLVLL